MKLFEPSRIAEYRAEREASKRNAKIATLETARERFVQTRDSLAANLDALKSAPGLKTRFDHSRIADFAEAVSLLDEEGLAPGTGLIPELVEFFESPEVVGARKLLKAPSIAAIEIELSRLREES